jgi:hypothetical protein
MDDQRANREGGGSVEMIIIERHRNDAPWRFSLRTLFLIVALVAFVIAIFRSHKKLQSHTPD